MREQERYDAERRRPAKKKKSRAERLTVTLLSLLFLAAAGVAVVKYLVRPPEPVENDPPQETGQDGGAEQADGGAEVISNGRERKQYCYTILLSGIDNDAGGSDTNILMRFDAVNKTIDLVSLPRDTLMRNGHKLNYSYAKGGTQMLRDEIAALLGIPVDFSVSVDLKGFIELVDQIGGVDFDVPINMDYDDPYQDLHIHFQKGMQHLDGQQAMEVVRFRHNNDGTGYGTEDIGRIGTQQAFLKAVAQKLLKAENVPAMAEVFLKYVKTDLTLGNLVWLGNEALNMGGMDAVSFHTLPGDGTGFYKGASVYVLDADAMLELVNSALNPYAEDISAEDMDILVP
ncbi:MAG: LCP family protein [Oscillospiraceae bacterium]|nr:LCP family protein [Oscillospiraceae bacterium]